ncbi:MAG TPA: ATP-binding cassette domain-containing protein [Candidatus Sumerlaeota bacterium]|nr:ATP-binding cassette domain-containing protein [Candidatus Sumerlaeota bacterium]HOR28389.1 ATP-binding cassette domain-containing protein [Candidatus Sumerlaeota bacterium]
MPLIECRNLQRRFGRPPHEVEALAGVSLAVDAGQWVWVVGPSASGKTTLLRALAGRIEP